MFRQLLLLSTLLISRSMDLWKISISSLCSIDKLLFPSFSISASSQYLMFLKSSRSCVLLPTPFASVFCPPMASWRGQFLLRIWPIQLTFLHRILFEVFSSLLYIQELVHWFLSLNILSSSFSSCATFQSSPNTYTPIFSVSRYLNLIKQCSKYNT